MGVRVLKISPVTEREVAAAEAELGFEIPETYRAFLRVTDGGRPVHSHFSELVGVQNFLGLGDVVRNYSILRGRIPIGMLPIAIAEGGNFILVATLSDRGAVYFWDHEVEHTDAPLTKLASSFDYFAKALKPRPNQSRPRPQATSVTVKNPELFRELQRRDQEAQSGPTIEWPPSES